MELSELFDAKIKPATPGDHDQWIRDENIGLREQVKIERTRRIKAETKLWRMENE